MFQLMIKAGTPQELRSKILAAAQAFDSERVTIAAAPKLPEVAADFNGDDDEDDSAPTINNLAEGLPLPNFTAAAVSKSASAASDFAVVGADRTVATVVGGDLDARGLPWDERIHASTKTKNKDGSWRNKKGLEASLIKQIENELAAKVGQTQSAQQTQVAAPPMIDHGFTANSMNVPVQHSQFVPPPPAPTIPVQVPNFAPVSTPTAPVTPPVVATAPTPNYENIPVPTTAQKPAHTLETFRKNMVNVFVELLASNKINQDYIEKLSNHFEVKQIWDVAKDDAKSTELFNYFAQHGLITKVG